MAKRILEIFKIVECSTGLLCETIICIFLFCLTAATPVDFGVDFGKIYAAVFETVEPWGAEGVDLLQPKCAQM